MKLNEFNELAEIIKKLESLEVVEWEIDNINLQYITQGQVNIRLLKKENQSPLTNPVPINSDAVSRIDGGTSELIEKEKKGKLRIEAVAILNESNPEFFSELMKKGADAIEPEMKKQLKESTSELIEKEIQNEHGK